jgi:peptide/nickel transport system ATP-binding protein/oligopeptide transport system ATP-binding protein
MSAVIGKATPAASLLEVEDLAVHFPVRGAGGGSVVKAVDGVSLSLTAGRTLALVGESGCGKSTTGYAILGLERATHGRVRFDGRDLERSGRHPAKGLAGQMQIVFQDATAALNPRMAVGDSIAEPLRIAGTAREACARRVLELLDLVGLPQTARTRRPAELSGGQRQRVVIARALALSPRLLICDEPVSALDVSIRSQILNLFLQLQQELGLAYLFISHDLSVVRHVADEVAVMYLGQIVEQGEVDTVFSRPRHPYTQALLSAIPVPDPVAARSREKIVLVGELPSRFEAPTGCPFHSRCPIAEDACTRERPPLVGPPGETRAACLVRNREVQPA